MDKKSQTATDDKSDVEVFGEKVHYHGHHGSGRVVWGVIILAAGVMLLLNNLNIVPWQVWNSVRQYWPVILILIGCQIVLGEGAVASFITAIVAIGLIASVFALILRDINSPLYYLLPVQITNILNLFGRYKL